MFKRLWASLTKRCATCSRIRLVLAVAVLSVVVGSTLVVGGAAGLAWTNTEKFCIGCHEMRDNVFAEFKDTIHDKNRTGVRATCPDCHVPREPVAMMKRKFQASWELYGHFVTGVIDTREKFEANRCRLATNVWKRMVSTDSLECRNCHHDDAWNPELQSDKSKARHTKARADGKTCIECHFGIAHTEPPGDCAGPEDLKVAAQKK